MRKRIYKDRAKKVYASSRAENQHTPSQLAYQELWMDNLSDEEQIFHKTIAQSRSFFNVPHPIIDYAEECFKRGFLSAHSYPSISDYLKEYIKE